MSDDAPEVIRIDDPAEYDRVRALTTAATREGYLNGIREARRIVRRLEPGWDNWQTRGLLDELTRELDRLLHGGAPR